MGRRVADILRSKLPKFSDQIAIRVDGGPALTYGELDSLSSRIAQWLMAQGIRTGERILVGFPNEWAHLFLATYFGVQKMGGTFVPLSPRLSSEEARRQAEHAEARLIFATPDLLDKWAEGVASFQRFTQNDLLREVEHYPPQDPCVPLSSRDTAEIIYTSGTTGTPKGIQVSHGALVGFDESMYQSFFERKIFLDPLPMHTFAGLTYLIFPIRMAMTNLVMAKFDPYRFADLLEKEPVFAVYAVSTMFLLLLRKVPDVKTRDFRHVALVQFGAAPMPPSAVLELCDLFPNAHVTNLYGLTEGGFAGCAIPPGMTREKYQSVGVPLPGVEVRIVDDKGNPLPPGEVGEVHLRSRLPARRYFRDENATVQTWDSQGWLHTGDLGYLDQDGYLYIVDRKKDLVIRGGYNISTLEVEDAFFRHPDVAEVAVLGIPHEILGEDLVAFVVPRNPENPPTSDGLREFLTDKLADYKIPRTILFVNELPKNLTGKVLKRVLREQLLKK